jgi:hypothetical protein
MSGTYIPGMVPTGFQRPLNDFESAPLDGKQFITDIV